MFEPRSGFAADPFGRRCDPASLFASRAHRRACSELAQAVERGGIALLSGESGVGKSTTIDAFVRVVNSPALIACRVDAAAANSQGVMQAVGEALGLAALAAKHKRLLVIMDDERRLTARSLAELAPFRPIVCRLAPLERDEVPGYIEQRVRGVGWRAAPRLVGEALDLIHAHTGGIPARINLLCARAFASALLEEKGLLDAEAVHRAIQAA